MIKSFILSLVLGVFMVAFGLPSQANELNDNTFAVIRLRGHQRKIPAAVTNQIIHDLRQITYDHEDATVWTSVCSQSKNPSEIVDRLKSQYPNISEMTLIFAAKYCQASI